MILSLCAFVVFTMARLLLSHALLLDLVFFFFVFVFSVLFSIVITTLVEERAGLCDSRAFKLCKAIHDRRNDTCPTIIPRNCACVKEVLIG